MNMTSILDFKKDLYSQNGEDGIIEKIFSVVGSGSKLCCEFGAWDGIHLSNTRKLLMDGWSGILLESDAEKFKQLKSNYQEYQNVKCLCSKVDDSDNSLEQILKRNTLSEELDFLSIDIDGLDYYIFKDMSLRPRLVCVEVNGGHSPEARELLPKDIAQRNVGQPLPCFAKVADELGYRLVCFTSNAFFLRKDLGHEAEIRTVDPVEAYSEYLAHFSAKEKRWLLLVNWGLVPPFLKFNNPHATAKALGFRGTGLVRILVEGILTRLYFGLRGLF